MAASLSDTLKGLISSRLVDQMSSGLAEGRDGVRSGLDLAFTAILGGLLRSQGDAQSMSQIASLVADPALEGGTLARLHANAAHLLQTVTVETTVVPGPSSTWQKVRPEVPEPAMEPGRKLNSTVFGISLESVCRSIGTVSGVRTSSATALLQLAAPMVLIALQHRLRAAPITGSALAALLSSDRARILASVHPGIVGPLGLGTLILTTPVPMTHGTSGSAEPAGATGTTQPAAQPAARPRLVDTTSQGAASTAALPTVVPSVAAAPIPAAPSGRQTVRNSSRTAARLIGAWLGFLALLALGLISLLLYQFWSQGGQIGPILSSGGEIRRLLPDGTQVTIRSESVEQRLLGDIEDRWSVVTRSRWIEIDGLTFETGSAVVTGESRIILTRLGQILRAYPSVRLKIGGYTDNQGDPEANRRLSEQRARAVVSLLRDDGIAVSRLEAEGFGESSPIADNATAEGRAKNRRIALQILQR
jgi:outer membrane protein OmpA-like peptidoglycan-associated protein